MADLSYPFRKAAWHATRAILPQSEKGFKMQLGAIGAAVAVGVIGIANISPDSTPVEGQDERITSYEQQIDQLSGFYANTVEKTREAWRISNIEDKATAQTEMDAAHAQFQNTAAQVLAGIYTEDGISEDAAADLLQHFEDKVGDLSGIEINGQHFADIGDAAFLHEAQEKYTYQGNELERAMDISQAAAERNDTETMFKIMSPLFGVMGVLVSILLMLLTEGITGRSLNKLEKFAQNPAPKPRKTGAFKH
ncbi:MAG: hypothetical protein EP349_10775 [Alphaproteobacteria bacterium]|nr:MAG: hypothetical protein EP349_10775 [Alphaproteobacteria bacterium]